MQALINKQPQKKAKESKDEYYLDQLAASVDLTDGNQGMKKLAITIYNELLQLKPGH